ncbi:MAG: 23S rRNA pseudouridine(2604) synthase RluF [Bacteroidota bacterium]
MKKDQQQDSISLNKYISETGICSRREADHWIEAGRVQLNEEVAQKGNRVFPGDRVLIDGRPLKQKATAVYIAYNKPPGITSTTDLKDKDNIIDAVNYPKRIFPIGRLDKPSEGLIFLTNDGDIVNKILRAGNAHEKEYIVRVDRPITASFVERMSKGIPILDTVTQPCFVEKQGQYVFRIILTQGLNRQIRRMCQYLHYRVLKLQRVRIMDVRLGKLKKGAWRYLTPKEIQAIQIQIAQSSKTEEASRLPKSKKNRNKRS